MLEYILTGIVLIIVSVLGYFLYKKSKSQQETIDQLVSKYKQMECLLTKPTQKQQVDALFENPNDKCDDCVIEPVKLKINTEDNN
jgi:hypothetical protein